MIKRTLIALPSAESATNNLSWTSGSTRRFNNFFNGLEIFPSTVAVTAAKACVVSSNFSKWVNFKLARERDREVQERQRYLRTHSLPFPVIQNRHRDFSFPVIFSRQVAKNNNKERTDEENMDI